MVVVRKLEVEANVKGNATKQLKRFNLSLTDLKSGLDLFVAASRKAIGFVKAFTTEIANEGDTIAKTAKNLGIGVQAVQELDFAAKISGVGINEVRTAIQRMQKDLNDARQKGTGPFADALKQIGVEVSAFDDLAPDEIFQRLASEVALLTDKTDKAALAQVFFGRGGKTLNPLLEAGAEGVKKLRDRFQELGGGFTDDGAASAELFNDSLLETKTVVNGLRIAVGEELLPEMIGLVVNARELFLANRDIIKVKIVSFIRKLVDVVRDLADSFAGLLETSGELLIDLLELVPVLEFLAKAAVRVIDSLGPTGATLALIGFRLAATGALGPVGAIAFAIGTIALAFIDTVRESRRARRELDKLSNLSGKEKQKFQTPKVVTPRVRQLLRRRKEQQLALQKANEEVAESVPGARNLKVGSIAAPRAGEKTPEAPKERPPATHAERVALKAEQNRLVKQLERTDEKLFAAQEKFERSGRAALRKSRELLRKSRVPLTKKPKRGKRGKQKTDQEAAVSDEELLKIIESAARSGRSLDDVLGGRSIEGTTPPIIAVTVTNFNFDQKLDFDIAVTGAEGQSVGGLAQMVVDQVASQLEQAVQDATDDIEPVMAR